MNRIALALLAITGVTVSAARADTRVSVGIHVGAPAYHPAPPAVVYAPAPVAVCPPPAVVVAPTRGYWKEVQVRTWVPERWVVRHNRWGRPERYCEPGYYAYRTERVWVDGRHDHHDHGRGYAYGHDRRGGWKR